jgi:phage terminase small subunit
MPILKNPKHEKYAQLLAKLQSQDAAYAGAGYKPNASHASRLARNGKVKARVAELVAIGAEKAGIEIADVLAELAKIGFANMMDYSRVTDEGEPFIDLSEMTRNQAAAVQQFAIEDFKDGRGEDARDVRKVTFKLHDKRAALVDIGKHLGMFKELHEHIGKDGAALVPVLIINGKTPGSK